MITYFIQGEQTKLIKIGKSHDLFRRLQVLQMGSPDRLRILAAISNKSGNFERECHLQFESSRVHGEWFNPSEELLSFIAALPKLSEQLESIDEEKWTTQGREAYLNGENRNSFPQVSAPYSASWRRIKDLWQQAYDDAKTLEKFTRYKSEIQAQANA